MSMRKIYFVKYSKLSLKKVFLWGIIIAYVLLITDSMRKLQIRQDIFVRGKKNG